LHRDEQCRQTEKIAIVWLGLPAGCAEILRTSGGVYANGGRRTFFISHSRLTNPNIGEEIAMHFCLTGQYTPHALKNIMENPTTNRYEAAKKLTEAAGGKLISMYSTASDGPGVLVIIDVPDPSAAPAMTGVVVESGALHHVKLTRLWTQDEIKQVRHKASELRGAYKPPGK
jgi:uncharacterized protein with GYD domain